MQILILSMSLRIFCYNKFINVWSKVKRIKKISKSYAKTTCVNITMQSINDHTMGKRRM